MNETSVKSLAVTRLSQPPLSHIMMCKTVIPSVAEMRMDFFSGVLALRRKRKAEATIQALFEICQRLGIVLGPPATLARHAVEISFDRMPALFNGRLKGLILTTAVLVTAFMRTDQPRALRVLCAAALSRALLAASKDGTLHTHPHDEDALLQLAQELILQFNNQQKTQLQAVSDRGAP